MKQRYQFLVLMLFLVAGSLTAFAQQRTVTGTITEQGGGPMAGVNVIVKGTSVGTTSDADGKYAINVNDGSNTLVFSFIGFATQEADITNRTTLDVTMVEDISELSEVVVTA